MIWRWKCLQLLGCDPIGKGRAFLLPPFEYDDQLSSYQAGHKDTGHTIGMVESWTEKRLGLFPNDFMELLYILYCLPPAFIYVREINFHPMWGTVILEFWSHAAKPNPNLASVPPMCCFPHENIYTPYYHCMVTYVTEIKSSLLRFRLFFWCRWLQSSPHLT